MSAKVEYSKQLALLSQQNDFLKKRAEELKKQADEYSSKFEEALKNQKEGYIKEINELVEKFNTERATLEEKYEAKRKAIKENEINYQKRISQLEKDKLILTAQLTTLEGKKNEFERKCSSNNEGFNNQIQELKESFNNERKSLLAEIENYREVVHQLEQEIAEIQANYDKDRALWEGKHGFLEQQRDQAKRDLQEAQKKFEAALSQLQKARNLDKESGEANQNSLISAMEKRYQTKIQEMQESFAQQLRELTERKEKVEKELKALNEKVMLENYGKTSQQHSNDKKILELLENEKRLLREIEELKLERDTKIIDYQKRFDKEAENLRAKVRELEQKYKESESRKSALLFEHEKEKAKWNVEKDYLATQNAELQGALRKSEKKRELLMRENEKLKSDNRSAKKGNLNSSLTRGFSSASKKENESPFKRVIRGFMDESDDMNAALKNFELYKQASQPLENISAARSVLSLSRDDENDRGAQ